MPRFIVTVRRDFSTEWADVQVTAKNKAEALKMAEKEAEANHMHWYERADPDYTAEEAERER